MSRWDRYVLHPRVWTATSRSETVPHIRPYSLQRRRCRRRRRRRRAVKAAPSSFFIFYLCNKLRPNIINFTEFRPHLVGFGRTWGRLGDAAGEPRPQADFAARTPPSGAKIAPKIGLGGQTAEDALSP